jgi:tetratricopeptide (TPR) repeat protein
MTMLHDRYGNPCSTQSRAAMDHYDRALELIRLYRGDPIAALDEALAEDPDFGGAWAARAGILVQQTDKAYFDETEKSLRAAAAANLNDRDRLHLAAAQDWLEGRYHAGTSTLARAAREHPRDLLALQFTHVGCFFLGLQQELRDGPVQGLRAFRPGDDGHGVLLGMAAFGYEECGDFARAEAYGREAVAIDARDSWAAHAVAHVHEMRGDTERGIPWLLAASAGWGEDCGFAYHNWWHLALLHMDRGDHDAALRVYDQNVRPNPDAQILLEWIDASALLWRLHLEGADTGDRFARLATRWERAAEDEIYAFNDLHAVMAFIGAGRLADAERTLAGLRRAADSQGDNAYFSRAVGLNLAQAFMAFARGEYADCAETICAVRGLAQRFGGSHAQRDVLTLTALHAALRGGMRETAQALAFERQSHKPHSPWAATLMRRAEALQPRAEAA